jgi:hypothetical protein
MRSWRATALLGAVVSFSSLVLSSAEASASCWYEGARLEDGGGGCIDVYVYYSCFERDGRLVMCNNLFKGCERENGLTITDFGEECVPHG